MRVAICCVVFVVAARYCIAGEKDHLQRGEPVLQYDWEAKYDHAIRRILSRGWKQGVVLRVVALPPFNPEAALGLFGTRGHYSAFVVRPSVQIWKATGIGGPEPHAKNQLSTVRPVFHSRPVSHVLATRIAVLFRHVLTDQRNYSKDENTYFDSTQTTFYLAFAPNEHITANMEGWGPHTEQLLWVNEALMDYAVGKKSEGELSREVAKREKNLGI